MISRIKLTPRGVGTFLFAGLVSSAIVSVFGLPTEKAYGAHNLSADHGHHFSAGETSAAAPHGFTAGWLKGETVQFFYTRQFFCEEPPTSGAPSECEVGEDGTQDPRPGPKPVLYVMTPLGFRPVDSTLHCPVVGFCINHPSTLDLSRIGGPANAPLPAHSHIIDEMHGGWWELQVIGVKSPAVWDQIVAGKSLATVRALQAADPAGNTITPDIRSNAYLFFDVRP